jgi:hypothetical protein
MRTLAHRQTPQEAADRRTHRPSVGPAYRGGHSAPLLQAKPFCPCDGGCPRCTHGIQPKLIIGQPGDIYEQEADRVAEAVMRMPEPAVQPKPT